MMGRPVLDPRTDFPFDFPFDFLSNFPSAFPSAFCRDPFFDLTTCRMLLDP